MAPAALTHQFKAEAMGKYDGMPPELLADEVKRIKEQINDIKRRKEAKQLHKQDGETKNQQVVAEEKKEQDEAPVLGVNSGVHNTDRGHSKPPPTPNGKNKGAQQPLAILKDKSKKKNHKVFSSLPLTPRMGNLRRTPKSQHERHDDEVSSDLENTCESTSSIRQEKEKRVKESKFTFSENCHDANADANSSVKSSLAPFDETSVQASIDCSGENSVEASLLSLPASANPSISSRSATNFKEIATQQVQEEDGSISGVELKLLLSKSYGDEKEFSAFCQTSSEPKAQNKKGSAKPDLVQLPQEKNEHSPPILTLQIPSLSMISDNNSSVGNSSIKGANAQNNGTVMQAKEEKKDSKEKESNSVKENILFAFEQALTVRDAAEQELNSLFAKRKELAERQARLKKIEKEEKKRIAQMNMQQDLIEFEKFKAMKAKAKEVIEREERRIEEAEQIAAEKEAKRLAEQERALKEAMRSGEEKARLYEVSETSSNSAAGMISSTEQDMLKQGSICSLDQESNLSDESAKLSATNQDRAKEVASLECELSKLTKFHLWKAEDEYYQALHEQVVAELQVDAILKGRSLLVGVLPQALDKFGEKKSITKAAKENLSRQKIELDGLKARYIAEKMNLTNKTRQKDLDVNDGSKSIQPITSAEAAEKIMSKAMTKAREMVYEKKFQAPYSLLSSSAITLQSAARMMSQRKVYSAIRASVLIESTKPISAANERILSERLRIAEDKADSELQRIAELKAQERAIDEEIAAIKEEEMRICDEAAKDSFYENEAEIFYENEDDIFLENEEDSCVEEGEFRSSNMPSSPSILKRGKYRAKPLNKISKANLSNKMRGEDTDEWSIWTGDTGLTGQSFEPSGRRLAMGICCAMMGRMCVGRNNEFDDDISCDSFVVEQGRR